MLKLYSYFRSSASYRVRIALNIKGIAYETMTIDLKRSLHRKDEYKTINPQGLVPTLVDDNLILTQSFVILDYIEQKHPTPPLLPTSMPLRWKAKELAQFIACEIHPLNNLRTLHYLYDDLKVSEDQKNQWYFHWLREGFDLLEKELCTYSTLYALDDYPTWIDLYLIPQMYNARRFNFDLSRYPRLCSIEKQCLTLDSFQRAAPNTQSDFDG